MLVKSMCVRSERLKRLLDLVGAGVGILLFGPLMLLIALVVWVTMGRPILFCQERAGRYGRPFRIIKFRTMLDLRDEEGQLLPDAQRLTRVGKWLRRFSLDELPEFFNVLRGEMSLVGPRPLYVRYIARYTPEQARRLEVRPGITGWAQIHGRNLLPWKERFAYDVWYVDHWNLCLDLKILVITLWQVIRGTGISARGHATMPEFRGNQDLEGNE